jgi:hypothetical protein
MTLKVLYTVTKMDDGRFYVISSMDDEETGMLGDGEMWVGPGETFLDRWKFEDIKEGQYNEKGEYLGEQWNEP